MSSTCGYRPDASFVSAFPTIRSSSIGTLLRRDVTGSGSSCKIEYTTAGSYSPVKGLVPVTIGFFAIAGRYLDWDVNLMFITGILAIIGYSVNNIVVIFDRIRENLRLGISPDFEVVVNSSLIETLGRSLNTIITTLITVFALMFFVGATIQNFVVVLVVGLIAGTFDSICVAPMLLVTWDKKEWGKFVSWLPFAARAKG
jgi:hypothetical protein